MEKNTLLQRAPQLAVSRWTTVTRGRITRGKNGARIIAFGLAMHFIGTMAASGQTTNPNALARDARIKAADQAGKDPCDKIKTAVGMLSPVGGIVDATGFTPAYLNNNPCTTAVIVNVPADIVFGAGTWKLQQPGCAFTIAASLAVLEGVSWATQFVSGVPNTAQICELSDAYHQYVVKNLNMKGNNTAYFGTFFAGQGYGSHTENVQAGGFKGAALFEPTPGMSLLGPIVLVGNSGDGMVLGSDGDVSGYIFVESNKGNGIHVVGGGTKINQVDSDHNYLSGIYLDGRTPPAWTGDTTYTTAFILPIHKNPGSYVYYGTYSGQSGSSEPTWPQTPGSTVSDGGVTWICVAPNSSIGRHLGRMAFVGIFGGFIDDNGDSGPAGVEADNIRIEGNSSNRAAHIRVVGAILSQAQQPINGGSIVERVMGLHAVNASFLTVSDVQWHGGAASNPIIKDSGGIVIDGGYNNTISSFTSVFGARNPIKIGNHAFNTVINGVNNLDNGFSGVSTNDSYCIYLESTTTRNMLSNILCDNTTNSWHGRGIGNASSDSANSVSSYENFTTQAGPDSLGDIKRH